MSDAIWNEIRDQRQLLTKPDSRAQSVGSSFTTQGCRMRLDPFDKNKIKTKLWEIKMFDGGSERGPQRGPMSDLCVLAIRTCLPHESETKSKFHLSLFWLRKRLDRITEIARILFLKISGQHVQNRILGSRGG